MSRAWLVAASVAAMTCTPMIAEAQLAQRSTLVVSAERLVGLYAYTYNHVEAAGNNNVVTRDDSGTMFNLLWGNSSSGSSGINPGAMPRLAVDYLVTNLISLGGSVGYWSATGSTTVINTKQDLPSYTGFSFAPRVGAAIGVTDTFTIWPRAGFTFVQFKTEENVVQNNGNVNTNRDTWRGFSLALECQFVYSPVPHFGFELGPIFEVPLSGSHSHDEVSPGVDTSVTRDAKLQNLGLTAGILGYL